MAHYRVLVVGSIDDIQNIYNTLPDSSSESAAELAFGFDYLDIDNSDKILSSEPFTKENGDLYKQVLDGNFYYCIDARRINAYGDYGYVNIKYQMEEEYERGISMKEEYNRHKRNKAKIIEHIKTLPNNQVFIFCDGHL